jgi:hypothetical protein
MKEKDPNDLTHKERVKERLDRGLPITSLDGFRKLGIVHIPSVIRDLKEEGYPIQTIPTRVRNRYGKICYINVWRKGVEIKGVGGIPFVGRPSIDKNEV